MDPTHDNSSMLPGGQLPLLPDGLIETVLRESEFSQGICSGVQLKGSDPDRYMTVCALLADGSLSQREISRLTGTSRNLVAGINRQAVEIEPLKQRLAGRARNLAQLCLERAEEIVQDGKSKVTLRDLAILAGVAIDKSQLLAGDATQRIETVEASSGADDFADQVERLQSADVQELSMDSAGEEPAVKGAAPAGGSDEGGAPGDAGRNGDDQGETDV